MGELIGYAKINGNAIYNHDYYRTVNNQSEIEKYRKELEEQYPDKKINFILKQIAGSNLIC